MKVLTALALAVLTGAQTKPSGVTTVPAALNFTMKSIDGKPVDLSKYQGRVVLMVNVASQCGYTPQYAGLEKLYERFGDQGRVIELDGISVEAEDWHMNVRPSNTEPLLRLNLEARTRELMERKRDEVLAVIRSQGVPQLRSET